LGASRLGLERRELRLLGALIQRLVGIELGDLLLDRLDLGFQLGAGVGVKATNCGMAMRLFCGGCNPSAETATPPKQGGLNGCVVRLYGGRIGALTRAATGYWSAARARGERKRIAALASRATVERSRFRLRHGG
jgi:hypothetical protein